VIVFLTVVVNDSSSLFGSHFLAKFSDMLTSSYLTIEWIKLLFVFNMQIYM
jgi:hypothetical protein